jgi:hypothetical protein
MKSFVEAYVNIYIKRQNSYLFNEFVCKLAFFGMSGLD